MAAAAMATSASTSGEWLKGALQDLRESKGSDLELDADLISGLVSFCELASPPDAASYLEVRTPTPVPIPYSAGAYIVRLLCWVPLDSDRSLSCAFAPDAAA